MNELRNIMLFVVLCTISFSCKERDALNPLDPDNPNTRGQGYTIQANVMGIGRVKVHWRKVYQPQVKSYRLYRSLEGGTPLPLADVADTLFFDTKLQAGTNWNYFYCINWEDGRELHQSPTASVRTFDAPTGFSVSNATRTRIELQWNDLQWLDNFLRCKIYRSSGSGFSLYDSTTVNQYADTRVDTGITYRYKLLAVATDGSQSNLSNETYATPGKSAPVIDSIKLSRPFTRWGEQVSITCFAHDIDGDSIRYAWQALDGGTISGSGRSITFRVPQDSSFTHRVTVTVSDSYSVSRQDSINIVTAHFPTSGLVAYFPFNNNANDESGNGRHGTVRGAVLTTDRFGAANSAYSFNGVNAYITAPVNIQPTGIPILTMTAWVNPSTYGYGMHNNRRQVLSNDDSSYGRSLLMEGTRWNVFVCYANWSSPTSVDLNAWQHLAVIYNGSQVIFYKNGLRYVSTYPGRNDCTSPEPLNIGRVPGWEEYFGGKIDDVFIYNRALSDEEIQMLYRLGGR